MSFFGGFVEAWKEADAYAFKERDRIDAKVTQLVPLLRKDKATLAVKDQKTQEALTWWESKFADYEGDDNKKKAVLNLVTSNPFKALKVAQEVKKIESVTGQTDIKGDKLLDFYDIISQTKPSDIEEEAWIEKAAALVSEPGVKNLDDMIIRLLNPKLSAKEFNEIYAGYTATTLPADPFVSTDYTKVMEMTADEVVKAQKSIVSLSEDSLINAIAIKGEQAKDTKTSSVQREAAMREKSRLERMQNQINKDQFSEDFMKEFATQNFIDLVKSQDALSRVPTLMMDFYWLYKREDGSVPMLGESDTENWIRNF